MAQVLGIIGGGQLGLMLADAAKNMQEISRVIVLDPTEECPATLAGAEQIVGDFKDPDAIRRLASESDIITYEIESGDSDVLKSVQNDARVSPSPETLQVIQDKLLQKTFLQEHNIPVGDFVKIESIEDLREKAKEYGYPVLLKTRRDAYDGRGNYKINNQDEIEKAFAAFEGRSVYLEKFVNYTMEVSVIAARNTKGEIKTYPLVENQHKDNILHITIAPARVDDDVAARAESIAHDTMKVLQGAGVFGIEMFVTQDSKILINEIAPRVHNSGHHTLQSSQTSQFEQHLRAILGLELGSTKLVHNTVMHNILGPSDFTGKYKPIQITQDCTYLKMYGKKESRPGRKMGHFNVVSSGQSTEELIQKAASIREDIRFEQP